MCSTGGEPCQSVRTGILRCMPPRLTTAPLVEEVPRLLAERRMSVSALAQRVGVTQSFLSKVLRGVKYKGASGDLARRIAIALDLPPDYFPEYRERFVLDRVRADAALRESLYRRLSRDGDPS